MKNRKKRKGKTERKKRKNKKEKKNRKNKKEKIKGKKEGAERGRGKNKKGAQHCCFTVVFIMQFPR